MGCHYSKYILASILILLTACQQDSWNNPYPNSDEKANIYYSSFSEQPKTLDPALSYNTNEAIFTAQIYEPPLQYHYLKRPFTLVPLTVTSLPKPMHSRHGKKVYTVYDIHIKPGIFYQPHPAFAKKSDGRYYYHDLKKEELASINTLSDFSHHATRELTADDYVYEIKRLAHPKQLSPIFGLMSGYILGLSEYAKTLQSANQGAYLDLRRYPLAGAKVLDRYTYRIILKNDYPQFLYWLTMPFFAPIPWEADYFYSQPGMKEKNITLAWYPVGTGPYMLVENNPNRRMTMQRNSNYHGETYPKEGEPSDRKEGLLADADKPLPFIDQFVFTLEKESIPIWNKFFQGYYDQSTISSDNFDEAIQVDEQGRPHLTDLLKNKHIYLRSTVSAMDFYMGFNMRDERVGGYSESARKLRHALSIAIDYEEYIAIFLNGRGIAAQGPISPGIFGYLKGEEGINPEVYRWREGRPQRRSLVEAKQLLAEAGYKDGRDPKTHQPLILNYDVPLTGHDDIAVFSWVRKQFEKLGLRLQVRDTQYNRFQEKMRKGIGQIYWWGWHADYPDPENFLFLLYGPNGKTLYGGENASNYQNAEYDKLFIKMKNLPNGAERQAVINRMVTIVRHDAPWIWGVHPKAFVLSQQWMFPSKINEIANNNLKYLKLDPILRAQLRKKWNQPIVWPIGIIFLFITFSLVPVIILYRRKERSPRL